MRNFLLLFFFTTFFFGCSKNELYLFNANNNSFTQKDIVESSSPTVFCFLSPTCPLCSKQTQKLQTLINKYNSKIAFYIVIPSQQLPDITITQNSALFKLPCPIYIDKHSGFSKQKKANTTPQYQLYANKQKLYDGKLDNTFKAINTPSFAPEYINYLNNAIDSFIGHKKITIPSTTPVGCFIE